MYSNQKFSAKIQGFLVDMDGTTYLGDHLLPGALEFWEYAHQAQVPFLFLTNNSSKDRIAYVQKFAAMGLEVAPEKIFSSGEASAQYLQTIAPQTQVAVFGTAELEREFRRSGFTVTVENPTHIVLGFDMTIDYAKLTLLCDFVRSGLPYIATHPDYNCPVAGGVIPDIGAIIAFVEASTGRKPDLIVGKPNRTIVEMAAARLKVALEALCMIGDRLYTDIAMGQSAAIQTALVLSGETKLKDIADSPFQPDYVFENLAELTAALRK